MNNDDFEQKLQALTHALHRPDPTPAWKADILARARHEAGAVPFKTVPPRWLMLSWAAAWVVIALMSFTTPRDVDQSAASNLAASHAAVPHTTTSPETLIAFQRHLNFNTDLP